MRAFFDYMWLDDAPRPFLKQKLIYVVLTGAHAEQGVLEVYDKGCSHGLTPAVASKTDQDQYFVHHADGIHWWCCSDVS
jgi:hypothetical protein